jgi:phenylacetate-CoA ligase
VDRERSALDDLEVRVEVPARVWGETERLGQLERQLGDSIQSTLGITCSVRLVAPGEIRRDEGKAVRVVDKR